MLDGGVGINEMFVVGSSLFDSGLLKNDFWQPDEVWIVDTAPREIPPVFGIPVYDFFGEHGGGYFLFFEAIFLSFEQVIEW